MTSGTSLDGIDAALEAQAFAYLAVRSLAGQALSVPTTTGTDSPTPGGRPAKSYG